MGKSAGTRRRYAAAGLCFQCGKRPPVDGLAKCMPCNQHSLALGKDRRERHRATGLCLSCSEPALDGKTLCDKHRERQNARNSQSARSLKRRVYDHYGAACECCGETILEFLTLDHINGLMGKKRETGPSGLYRAVVNAGYPTDIRVLCMNCNWGRRYTENGVCPHKLVHAALQ